MENKEWNFEPSPSEPAAYEPEAYTPDPAFAEPSFSSAFEPSPQPTEEPSPYDLASSLSPSEPSAFEPSSFESSTEPPAFVSPEPAYSSAFEPQVSESYAGFQTDSPKDESKLTGFDSVNSFSDPSSPTYQTSSPSVGSSYSESPQSFATRQTAQFGSNEKQTSKADIEAILKEQEMRIAEGSLRTLQALKAQEEEFIPDTGYEYMTKEISPDRYKLNPILPSKLTDNISDELLFEKHQDATAEQNEAYRKLMYLKKLINKDLSWYNNKFRKYSFTASVFKISVVLLSAIVTVLLGLDYVASEAIHQQIIKDIALLMSAMIAVITGLERFFDAKDLMVQYMKTFDKLEQMKTTIEYIEVGGHYNLVEVERLKLKYDKVVVSTSNFVVEVRADEN
jgi:hypothetical protein